MSFSNTSVVRNTFSPAITTSIVTGSMEWQPFPLPSSNMVELVSRSTLFNFSELEDSTSPFNPFQPSVAFHIETNHLICLGNQMTGFYVKCNTGLKWVKQVLLLKTVFVRPESKTAIFSAFYVSVNPCILLLE